MHDTFNLLKASLVTHCLEYAVRDVPKMILCFHSLWPRRTMNLSSMLSNCLLTFLRYCITEHQPLCCSLLVTVRKIAKGKVEAFSFGWRGICCSYGEIGLILRSHCLSSLHFGLAMTHDAEMNTSCGMLQGLQKEEIEKVVCRLEFWKQYACYPSLLPSILIELKADILTDRLGTCHQTLYNVELNSGLHKYTCGQDCHVYEIERRRNTDLDFAMRDLSGIVARLASCNYNCAYMHEMLDCLDQLNCWRRDHSTATNSAFRARDNEMEERLQYLRVRLKAIEMRSTYLLQRTRGQIQSVRGPSDVCGETNLANGLQIYNLIA
jgi:hypothetical protein